MVGKRLRGAGSLDELDRRLITELLPDPRITYSTLGKRLGVSGMTAAMRLQRLRASGVLHLKALPDLPALGLRTEVLGLLQVNLGALPAVVQQLESSPYVFRLDRVTGEFDFAFLAVFPSETALGALMRDLQGIEGVQRLVVHHVLEHLKESEGWEGVWAAASGIYEAPFEVAAGVTIPPHLEAKVSQAATWVDALARADYTRLRELSTPDIVFTIMPPHPSAGTFAGIEAVEKQADRTQRAYRRLWYRIVNVTEATSPYDVVIDAISPVEDRHGQIGTRFSRMAFGFVGGKIQRVVSLGQMDLPELSAVTLDVPDATAMLS